MIDMYEDWKYSLHNLELLSYRGYFCFVPNNSPTDLKKDIKAVLAKNFMRYSSVDYVLKKFIGEESIIENNNPYYILLTNIQSTIWQTVTKIGEKNNRLKLKEETNITLEVTSAFMRLENSFESIMFLIYNRFYFESMSINRLIFEQINYCFNVVQYTPEEFKRISKSQANKYLSPTNITKLKNYFNKPEIAKLYSTLCRVTHLGQKGAHEFIGYDIDDNQHYVTMRSVTQAISSAIFLLYITDLYGLVFEYCLYDKSNLTLDFLKSKSGNLVPNQERKIIKQYKSFINDFEKLLREVEIPVSKTKKPDINKDNFDLPF